MYTENGIFAFRKLIFKITFSPYGLIIKQLYMRLNKYKCFYLIYFLINILKKLKRYKKTYIL